MIGALESQDEINCSRVGSIEIDWSISYASSLTFPSALSFFICAIGSISVAESGFLVAISIEQGAVGAGFGGAEGLARAYDRKGSLLWQIETPLGHNIEHVAFGPTINSDTSAWIVSWDNRSSSLEVRTIPDGNVLMTVQMSSRVNAIVGNLEYLAIGFDDGSVYLLQGGLLTRRLESEASSEVDEHRSTMAEKLRRLRT